MNRRFNRRETLEHARRAIHHNGRQPTAAHDAQDLTEAAMRLIGRREPHPRPRATQRVLTNRLCLQRPALDRQRRQPGAKPSQVDANVEQRPEQHVARSPAEAVDKYGTTHAG
jgi:hypothetical protein